MSWFATGTELEDDDIVVGQVIQSLKCPITLSLLEEPVRNSKCPHVYSKAAIMEMLRRGQGRIPCPVAGCGADVTKIQLSEDKVMARKVREEKARREEASELTRPEVQDITEGTSEIIYEEDIKVE